ncbi:MAG: hypothetical protein JSR19_12780 [Proteobacteria bacterium]|nr:hypothetical protein [Pseudomonadota bacterium]HQR04077.1 hypothetical protein [Rhodocyclaceae bacterium]
MTSHTWRFFRAGGFDQVRIDSAADLLALPTLDHKLWLALSCPVQGIEFDSRTLALVDSDADGHIRAPELLAAIAWAAEQLDDTEVLGQGLPGVPLAAIRATAPAAAAAQALAAELGKTGDALLTVEEASAAEARHHARHLADWEAAGAAVQILGPATEEAWNALEAIRNKVEDYFVRCRLAAFDSRAAEALNADIEALKILGADALQADTAAIAALPLARIEAGRALPLTTGLNPAWAGAIATLRDALVEPLLGTRTELDETGWQAVQEKLAPYGAWCTARPGENSVDAADLPPEVQAARDLERLARYVRDLLPLANNFVAFRDFYTRRGKGSFQVGTLYFDGRSAELCVAVNDAARHAALAGLARMCLVYCDCVRGAEKRTVAAAFTAGDADQLIVGRNGVFYDRQGGDWDATIVRVLDHPISLRQAFWSPYKRLGRLVGEQMQKLAASKAGAVETRMAGLAADAGKKVEAPPVKTVAQQAFDVGKFAGIFAAIGLAVGAIGTAIASLVTGLLGLKAWQLPLALLGLMLAVSGPAMVIAWFKLRSRNLGPLLDANGWAINARARINIPFGTSLTALPQLPAGAERSLADPYADKGTPAWVYILLLLLAAVLLYLIYRHFQ